MNSRRKRFAVCTIDALESRRHFDVATPIADFTWKMEDRYGVDSNHNGIVDLPNSRQYANPKGFPIDLDATATQSTDAIKTYQWTIAGGGLKKPLIVRSKHAIVTDVSLPQGNYSVQLQVTDSAKASASTTQQITVRNYLIVDLGDSYASGEGNPEAPSTDPDKVKWADGVSASMTRQNLEAHRSSAAAASQAALLLEQSDPHSSVTFINLAESGATISQGMLGSLSGRTHASYKLPGQIAELHKIIGSRPIDDLTLSIGGNDFGFVDFIAKLLQKNESDLPDFTSIEADVQTAQAELPVLYARLSGALSQFTIRNALITAYPDITQVAPGDFETFAADVLPGVLIGITPNSAQFASEQIVAPLNDAIQSAASANNWTFVSGYATDFLSHGYAAATPWFRTEAEAKVLQGSDALALGILPVSSGGFHPNPAGLADIAQSLYGFFAAS